MKKNAYIFLCLLLSQFAGAQSIMKYDNGRYICYKNSQGETVIPNKRYIIAFTDTISSIGFVGNRKGQIVWRKRSIPTHSGWLYPLTFDAGKGLKEA